MARHIKEALLASAGIVSGALMVIMAVNRSLIGALALALFFSAFFSLSALLKAPHRYAYLLTLTILITAGLSFYANPWLLFGVATSAGFLLLSWFQIKRSEEVSMNFSVVKSLRAGLPLFFTSLALLGSLFFYEEQKSRETVEFIPRQAFSIFFPYFAGVLGQKDVKANPDDTIDQLITRLVEQEAKEALGTSSVPASYLNAFVRTQREALSKQFGVELTGDEKAGDVFYTIANKKANEIAGPYIDYLPIAFSIGIFFALKALSLPISWLSIALASLIVWVLRKTGMLQVVTQSVTITSYTL